jgi:hypothetical protein
MLEKNRLRFVFQHANKPPHKNQNQLQPLSLFVCLLDFCHAKVYNLIPPSFEKSINLNSSKPCDVDLLQGFFKDLPTAL